MRARVAQLRRALIRSDHVRNPASEHYRGLTVAGCAIPHERVSGQFAAQRVEQGVGVMRTKCHVALGLGRKVVLFHRRNVIADPDFG